MTAREEICHVAVGSFLAHAADCVVGVRRCKTQRYNKSVLHRGGGGIFRSQRKPTGNLDPFAQRTGAGRLAVLAFIVATVETFHARAHGVHLSRAFLLDRQVAVWKNSGEPCLKGPRLPQRTTEDECQ